MDYIYILLFIEGLKT